MRTELPSTISKTPTTNEPTIRRLHRLDAQILTTAWMWRYDTPEWFRDSLNSEPETLEEFLELDELRFGIFTPEITAVIRLDEQIEGIYELHLLAKRATDIKIILQAGLSIKKYLFENKVRLLFGWIPSVNRGIIQLYRDLGFVHNGETCYKGKMRGRPIKWLLMQCENGV